MIKGKRINVRVREPLHKQIVKTARLTGRSISDEVAVLIERGFEWTDYQGNRTRSVHAEGTKIVIAKLETSPGDTLVVRTDLILTAAQVAELRERLRTFTPEGVELMILTHGLKLDVLKKAAA